MSRKVRITKLPPTTLSSKVKITMPYGDLTQKNARQGC